MTVESHAFDRISVDQLRAAAAGKKWTLYPGKLGAFIAEMDFGCAPEISTALHQAVADGVFGYLPAPLEQRVAHACAAWHARNYGWNVDAGAVHIIPDVITGLQLAIRYFSRPDGAVIVPTPAYMPFLQVPRDLGSEVIELPMLLDDTGYRFDLDALAAAFAAGGSLLVLCNPHNPVGAVYDSRALTALSEVVEAGGGRVFADEVHAPLTYPGSRHVPYASISATAARHSVTSTSASKAWNLAGLKCGQLIITNDADAATWSRLPGIATRGASIFGAIANAVAYESGAEWLAAVVDYLDGTRHYLNDLLATLLPATRWRVPDATYMAWLDLRDLGLGDQPATWLAENAGVVLTEGTHCGEGLAGFARLNFATPRPIVRAIVEQIADSVARWR